MPNLTGQSIGRYHILEQLGEGGMATVYKAYDTRLERNVAFKVLRTEQFSPILLEQVLRRFEREAKSLAKLSHPNIVNILDYGEHEGNPYLVMEYLPGGTLKQKLGQAIPWQDAIQTLLPIANGLAFAHQHNIIHRDVKPANILISETNRPILTDFGIAKLLEGADGHTLTASGVGIGTPEYMAPEQGIGAHTIDARADIYSLGIVLYEMVTGRKPYIADTPMAVVLKQMTDPLPRPTDFVPDLPEGVEHILFKALAKQPDDRYPDMNALISAMDGVLTEKQKFEAPLSTITAKKKAKPSPKVVRAVIWTLAIGLIIVFGTPWIKQQFSWTSETTSTAKFIAPATSTITIIPPTKTLGASPSPILTETALPTTINTPAPSWVTDFAEPIIAAIKDRGPDFQDDFSIDTHQWHVYINWGNTQYPLIIDKGVMSIYQSSVSNFYFLHKPNIVFQVDALSPISDAQTVTLASNFFDQPDPLKLQLDPLNQWSVRLHVENEIAKGSYQSGGEKTQLMYVVNGPHVAFYVNETPVAYYEYPRLLDDTENERLFQCMDTCYFDNVKLWNLDNIPLPASLSQGLTSLAKPTEMSQPTSTSIPLPAWANNFAEPILTYIANHPPTFEDNFEQLSNNWVMWTNFPPKMYKMENGKLLVPEWPVYRRGFQFDDYVVEADIQFVPSYSREPAFKADFRDGYCHLRISESSHSHMEVGCGDKSPWNISKEVSFNNSTFSLRLIVKGTRFLVYINGTPMGYFEYEFVKTGNAKFEAEKGTEYVLLDNFKVWDITDMEIP